MAPQRRMRETRKQHVEGEKAEQLKEASNFLKDWEKFKGRRVQINVVGNKVQVLRTDYSKGLYYGDIIEYGNYPGVYYGTEPYQENLKKIVIKPGIRIRIQADDGSEQDV